MSIEAVEQITIQDRSVPKRTIIIQNIRYLNNTNFYYYIHKIKNLFINSVK